MRPLILLALLVVAPRAAWTQPREPRWTAEASIGDAYSFPTRLDVHQLGYPLAIQHATWETRAFEFPIYWALRATRWRGDRAWAFELIHHKLHLTDPAAPVDDFAVTHGFNLLTVGRLLARGDLHGGLVAGAVIAHPENTVRGFELSQSAGIGGYYLAGPTGGVLLGWHRDVRRAFVVAEARFMASYAHIPVFEGHASVVHLGLHGHLGVGWRLGGATMAP
jgi:hypothetical protein